MQPSHTLSPSTSPAAAAVDYTSPAPPIAWQAIQDAGGALVGHEIFNRSRVASAHTTDSDLTLAHAVLSHLEPVKLLGQGLLFLNTTFESLHGAHLDLLPANQVVLEIPSLGHAASSEALARRPALEALRAKGFALAFNHAVLDSSYAPWHDLVNYLKIDFSVLTAERAVLMIQWARRMPGATVIADKIETAAQLQLAQEGQVDLLQGYAVTRPEPVAARVVLPSPHDVAALSAALQNQADAARLAQLLQRHPALTFNLLRMARTQSIELRASYSTLEQLIAAYPHEHLHAWEAMLQAVATKSDPNPERRQIYADRCAQLQQQAHALWPGMPADSLRLIVNALLIGRVLELSVDQSALQLLPSALTAPVQAAAAQWQALLHPFQ